MMSEKVKFSLRVFVSLACFFIVFAIIDYDEMISLTRELTFNSIILVLVVMCIGHIGSGLRFRFILGKLGKEISRSESIKAGLVALWFNQILPTGMGGDVVRAMMLAKDYGKARIILAALQDRIFGLMMMLLMMLCFVPISLTGKINNIVVIILSLSAAVGLFIGLSPIYVRRSNCVNIKNKHLFLICRLFAIQGFAMSRILNSAALPYLFVYLAVSLFPYVLFIAIIGNEFRLEVGILEYVALVPIMFIAMQFPITIGGWGARELASIYVFSLLGMSEEIAVIISVLYGVAMLITSVPGNVFWVARKPATVSANI